MRTRIGVGGELAFDLPSPPDSDSVSFQAYRHGVSHALDSASAIALPDLIAVEPVTYTGTLSAPIAIGAETGRRYVLPIPVTVGTRNAVLRRVEGTLAHFDRPIDTPGAILTRRAFALYRDEFGAVDIDITVACSFKFRAASYEIKRQARVEGTLDALPFNGDALIEAWPDFALLQSTYALLDPDTLVTEAFGFDVEPALYKRGVQYGSITDAMPLRDVTVNRALARLARIGYAPAEFAGDLSGYIEALDSAFNRAMARLHLDASANGSSASDAPPQAVAKLGYVGVTK